MQGNYKNMLYRVNNAQEQSNTRAILVSTLKRQQLKKKITNSKHKKSYKNNHL